MKTILLTLLGCLCAAPLLAALESLLGVGIARLVETESHGFLILAAINLLVLGMWTNRMKPVLQPFQSCFIGSTVIPCILERGGFSTEVTFSIDTGELNRHIGFSHQDHVLNDQKKAFEADELPPGALVNGYVKCRRLRTEGQMALVEVPGGESIHVRCDELEEA